MGDMYLCYVCKKVVPVDHVHAVKPGQGIPRITREKLTTASLNRILEEVRKAEREKALLLIRDMKEWMESMCGHREWTKKKYIAYECLGCHVDRCNSLNCKHYDKISKRIEDYDDRIKRAQEYEEGKE